MDYNIRPPKKWIWTEDDFEDLCLSDTFVYGVGFTRTSLLLDLDLLVHWEPAAEGEDRSRYWMAPATLEFENVEDVKMQLEPSGGLVLLDVEREPRRLRGGQKGWLWQLDECCSEGISLLATGFKLVVRGPGRWPTGNPASLSQEERGGISFSMVPGGA